MKKKAQVMLFIIIAVVVVALGFIGYRLLNAEDKTDQGIFSANDLPLEQQRFDEFVGQCIRKVYEPLLREIALAGGSFKLTENRLYDKTTYNYACLDEGDGCKNLMITRDSMAAELEEKALPRLEQCLNFEAFEQENYEIKKGQLSSDVKINIEDVTVTIDYPVELTKEDSKLKLDSFEEKLDIQLGMLYDLFVQILDSEIENVFDESSWMKKYDGLIEIEKHKPYPDIVYSLRKYNEKNHDYLYFNFAVQGYDTSSVFDKPIKVDIKGYCYDPDDNNCYYNVLQDDCDYRWSEEKPDDCRGLTDFSLYSSDEDLDCGNYKDGQSWCVYDGIAGVGFDPVGSRHYKQTCINGKIFSTECRDYREELCTEDSGEAVCRQNRWRDCSEQTDKADCLDTDERDCYWSDWLYKSEPFRTITYDFTQKKCFPYVPPGLKHWQGSGQQVCRLANEQFDCDGTSCAKAWVDTTAIYCYFQADCGNYFNQVKDMSTGTGANSDGEPRSYVSDVPYSQDGEYSIGLPLHVQRKDYSGTEFINMNVMPFVMKANYLAYKQRSQGFKESAYHDILPAGIFGPKNDKIDVDALHDAYCNVWSTPLVGDCESCNNNPIKPCSEYKCKSLGRACQYSEQDGIGRCTLGEQPEYNAIALRDANYLTDDANLLGSDFSDKELGSIDLDVDFYDDIEGFEIKEPLEPYSNVVVYVESSVPVDCVINEYETKDIFQSGLTYSEKFPLPFKARPPRVMMQDIYDGSLLQQIQGIDLDIDFDELRQNLEQAQADIPALQLASLDTIAASMGIEGSLSEIIDQLEVQTEEMKQDIEDMKQEYREYSIMLESNIVYGFVNCHDLNGKDYLTFVKYKVGSDTRKPVLIDVDYETQEAYFNEPVECSIDGVDIVCENSYDDKYLCKDPAIVLGAELECTDNVPSKDEFDLYLIPGETTGIYGSEDPYSGNAFINDGTLGIYVPEGEIMAQLSELSLPVEITTDKQCYANDLMMDCSEGTCKKNLFAGDYHVVCMDDVGTRNTEVFVLS